MVSPALYTVFLPVSSFLRQVLPRHLTDGFPTALAPPPISIIALAPPPISYHSLGPSSCLPSQPWPLSYLPSQIYLPNRVSPSGLSPSISLDPSHQLCLLYTLSFLTLLLVTTSYFIQDMFFVHCSLNTWPYVRCRCRCLLPALATTKFLRTPPQKEGKA